MAVERTCRMGTHPYADRRRKTADRQDCEGCLRDWQRRTNEARPIPDWQRPPGAAEARERYAAWAAGLDAALRAIRLKEGFDGRRRTWRTLGEYLACAALAVTLLLPGRAVAAPSEGFCIESARVTGYVRGHHSPWTADGTSIWTPEPIAAGSYNLPLGWYVDVDGLGRYRIADRGMLGSTGWVDIATWDLETAYAITSTRRICVFPPEEAP